MKKIIFLQGGLGNQMFQYAFYLSLKQYQIKVYCDKSIIVNQKAHNGYELENIFNIKSTNNFTIFFILKILYTLKHRFKINIDFLRKIGFNLIEDTIPSIYNQNFINSNYTYNLYLGYWQSEKYFINIQNQIKQTFSFNKNKLSPNTLKCLNDILSTKNSVSIHVRRGDFLSPKFIKLHGNICTLEYYEKAIDIINKKNPNPHFYIFSDDSEWVKKNLRIQNCTYITFNKNQDSWQDMFLMSQCKHNILANSSFSWWGAWLNSYENKIVIAPKQFLNIGDSKDLIPDSWIKI